VTTLLIDGDPIAYQCAFSNENRIDWDGDGNASVTHDEVAALADVDLAIKKMKADLGAKKVVVCLSVPTILGWRRELLSTYKSNRNKAVKPLALEPCRQHMLEKWGAYIRPTLEADDVLGILATNTKVIPGEKIIVTIDKDLKTIPGRIYNPRRQKLETVSREEADYLHMMQTLTGDTVDGYSGCPGVGPKRAVAALDGFIGDDLMWPRVVLAYEARGLTEDDALVQARVARICRSSDYDFKAKKVKLWTPPN